MKGMLTVVAPDPADFRSVPEFVRVPTPPLKTPWIWESLRVSHVPVLLIAVPVPARICPEIHVAVPVLLSVRVPVSCLTVTPLTFKGPLTVVTPAPVISPPDQSQFPSIVSVPVPPSVPPVIVNAVTAAVEMALLTFIVPPLTCTVPGAGVEIVLLTFRVPPLTSNVPIPVKLVPALRSNVPPANCNVTDGAELLNPPVLLPPAPKLIVPVRTSTVPLFVKGRLTAVVPDPAAFVNAPEFVKVPAPPLNTPWISESI